jgi:outer membrane protein assembly factor BamB
VIWSIGGLSNDSVISPVFHEKSGLLLSCTSWPKKILYAIRPDGSGDVTETKVVWSTSEGAPYVPSPIAVGDWFFTSSFVGTSAYCYEAATGEVLWKQSMGLHHASPVYADGLLYFLNDNGETHVVRAAAEYELVAKNDLGEKAYASPAISGGQIFIRGFEHLYCIGRP